ncbi:hypothetical protein AAZX31_12G168400 [Glycine max]|nr:hypothetical protein GLYMA_12G179050v4 [Glycine max]KAG4385882.1 hypothetical protein GLYMA_12G179050v4 [Glycine max]KAH1143728.1 hypothetical protein GYH30_034116 [Glycine max]KAH1143729.1 hypothetical protein GYH30_034116 [Glycine max]
MFSPIPQVGVVEPRYWIDINNGGLLRRGHSKAIKMWTKKFEKLIVSSKGDISIRIDGFDNFIKACGIGKRSEARCFRKLKYRLKRLQRSYMKTSNSIRSMYLGISLYTCRNHTI